MSGTATIFPRVKRPEREDAYTPVSVFAKIVIFISVFGFFESTSIGWDYVTSDKSELELLQKGASVL